MYIESLELKNYRNYQNLQLDFDKGTNIFYGDNAQGMFFMVTLSPPKASLPSLK